MTTLFRFLQFFSVGTWVGAILFFSAIVAPAAFGVLSSRDQAGALAGLALTRLHLLGMVAGLIFLAATAAEHRTAAALVRPAPLLVAAMIVLTFVSQFWVSSELAALRTRMGSVEATPVTDPLRVSFDRLHRVSVQLESVVLLCGIAAMVFTSRRPAP